MRCAHADAVDSGAVLLYSDHGTGCSTPSRRVDDLLADVIGRLPARSLAASRCVCRSWRGVVDDCRLLLPHRLPHSVDGLLLSCIYLKRAHVFARPTTTNTSCSYDHDVFTFFHRVYDQCNGLVLFDHHPMYLCNPTTRCGVWLPIAAATTHDNCRRRRAFVAFDPAVSPPHWEVLQAPLELEATYGRKEMAKLQAVEWPPAKWAWSVCSSTTMAWHRRVFVRQGEAAGTAAGLVLLQLCRDESGWDRQPLWSCSAYCQGVL
ncbi:hypothetical protein U9M48_001297 [Paspalum notatum var. saurae]|uniref:F-box domain-containing protein n=1 Tax=Paspalum notatum var. saurae TaxID=547442 RepID=A0AAQ3SF31_PASNO